MIDIVDGSPPEYDNPMLFNDGANVFNEYCVFHAAFVVTDTEIQVITA